MKENRPSETAYYVAMRHAAHQILDDPKVLVDPLALRIIGEEVASELKAYPYRFENNRLSPYMRAFLAARSRYAEDELAKRVQDGARQYVILGAGLDTFAFRNPYREGSLHVFEVDHPSTQAWKKHRLAEAGIIIRSDVTLVSIDFENQTLEQGLIRAGFSPDACTFFSWLGVALYLTAEAFWSTLRFIVSMPSGSGVVFDYHIDPAMLTGVDRVVFDSLSGSAALSGEPWLSFFKPESLQRDLLSMGFSHAEDHGLNEINKRYFNDRGDGLKVRSNSHIMIALL